MIIILYLKLSNEIEKINLLKKEDLINHIMKQNGIGMISLKKLMN